MESSLPLNSLCGWGLPWTPFLPASVSWGVGLQLCTILPSLGIKPTPHISKGIVYQQTYIPNSSKGFSALAPLLQCEDRATRNHLGLRDYVSSDSKPAGSVLFCPASKPSRIWISTIYKLFSVWYFTMAGEIDNDMHRNHIQTERWSLSQSQELSVGHCLSPRVPVHCVSVMQDWI